MAERSDLPQSWLTVAITVVALLIGAQWAVSSGQFKQIDDTLKEVKAEFSGFLTKDEHKAYISGISDQLSGIRLRLTSLEATLTMIQPRLAHDPVEDRTFQATVIASDKRIDLIQAQITDLNRQIAAALIIIDNNASARKTPTLPP